MFQLLRRVSSSFLPRPDRPWSDDATSHAPTTSRKRRYSVTEQDDNRSDSSAAKRVKSGLVASDPECDSASEGESANEEAPPEGQDLKEVTKGVNEVDLEDENKAEDPSSMGPEGVPLPDSPSGSPEPEPEPPQPAESDVAEETRDERHPDDGDSCASSSFADETEGPITNTEILARAALEEVMSTVESNLHDTLDTLEVKA